VKKFDITKGKKIVFWFTGLSNAGKTTLAKMLEKKLQEKEYHTELIDSEHARDLYPNLKDKFSKKDRLKYLKNIANLAAFYARDNITIVSTISPYKKARKNARKMTEKAGHQFIEIYVSCPLWICETRDEETGKNQYQKARAGEIENFTGISDPYEEPKKPDITVLTDKATPDESLNIILSKIKF